MLNRYPLWKNLVIILVVFLGVLYALPNLYGEDPAVQISGTRGREVDTSILAKAEKVLTENKIELKSYNIDKGSMLLTFNNTDDQLLAKDKIIEELGNGYSIALNLSPATPEWLLNIGGNPMKLGLDLRGGVRFLMEVDMNTALSKFQDSLQDTLRAELHKEKIAFTSIKKSGVADTLISFDTDEQRTKAERFIKQTNKDVIITVENKNLKLVFSPIKLAEERNKAVEQNIAILRKRVNELGVAEPIVQRQGAERIVVELPGIQDTARAKEILGATATLEFRMVNENVDSSAIQRGRISADSEVKLDRHGRSIVLYRRMILGGEHITNASASTGEYGMAEVNISLDNDGGKLMSNATKNSIGKPMATLYSEYKDSGKRDANDKIIMEKHEEVVNVATIQARLGNTFRITGLDTMAEAQNLAVLLRSGALIAPIQIVEERTIGPSLGAENISKGIDASVIGLAITALFMIFYYRNFGMIANLALTANIVILIGVMSLIPGITLSMPGIAGIVLTIAMALDANILIYERIKEELRNGRTVQQAIDHGYSGAYTSIFDANLTTLLTAIILYAMGTGPVKGFAITVSLGVIISMFTAIMGTRAIVNWRYGGKKIDKLSI